MADRDARETHLKIKRELEQTLERVRWERTMEGYGHVSMDRKHERLREQLAPPFWTSHLIESGCEALLLGEPDMGHDFLVKARERIDSGIQKDDSVDFSWHFRRVSQDDARPMVRFLLWRARFITDFLLNDGRHDDHLLCALDHAHAWIRAHVYSDPKRFMKRTRLGIAVRVIPARLLVGQLPEARADFEALLGSHFAGQVDLTRDAGRLIRLGRLSLNSAIDGQAVVMSIMAPMSLFCPAYGVLFRG